MKVKCNKCGWTGDEDDLVIFEDAAIAKAGGK